MKDKHAFEESVFTKSNIIFEKRKKRRKTALALTTSSLCVLFIFTALLRSPVGLDSFAPKKSAEAEVNNAYGPKHDNSEDIYYAANEFETVKDASADYDKKHEIEAPQEIEPAFAETQASTESVQSTAAEATKFPYPADEAPTSIEIVITSSTASVYKSGNDMEKILLALSKYSALEEKSEVKIAEITVNYSIGNSYHLVGQEFFDILDEIKADS